MMHTSLGSEIPQRLSAGQALQNWSDATVSGRSTYLHIPFDMNASLNKCIMLSSLVSIYADTTRDPDYSNRSLIVVITTVCVKHRL